MCLVPIWPDTIGLNNLSGSTWQFILLFTTFWGLNEEKSSITLKSQCSQSSTTHEVTKFGVNQVPLGIGGTMKVTSWKRLEKEHQLGACMVHGRVQKCGTAQNGHVSGDMIIIHQFRGYPMSHTKPHRSTCFAICIHEIPDFPWIFMTQIHSVPKISHDFFTAQIWGATSTMMLAPCSRSLGSRRFLCTFYTLGLAGGHRKHSWDGPPSHLSEISQEIQTFWAYKSR